MSPRPGDRHPGDLTDDLFHLPTILAKSRTSPTQPVIGKEVAVEHPDGPDPALHLGDALQHLSEETRRQ